MSLQTILGGGLWAPPILTEIFESASTYVIDAAGEQVALIMRAPRAGVIDRFDFNIHAVGNSPDNGLRASLQTVDLTTGLPSGTILGATNNGFVTYAHTVTTGWKSTNFGETVTVTKGQLIALVIDIPSFTVGDSVTIKHVLSAHVSGFPHGVSATATKNATAIPVIALHYTDGYAVSSVVAPPILAWVTATYASNTGTADEWGLAFSVPVPCALDAVAAYLTLNAGGDFEVILYDSGDTPLATLSHDGDVAQGSSSRLYQFQLSTAVNLTANATYRLTIRPTTTTNVSLIYWTFQSLELMNTMGLGTAGYMTSRLDQAGAWTDYNSGTFRKPAIFLNFSAFDDGVSAGGGLLRHGGMAGGMNA